VICMNAEEALQLKVRLLTQGARFSDKQLNLRKGGAGPVGGKYFILPNGLTCGVPIRQGEMAKLYKSAPIEQTDNSNIWIYDNEVELKSIPRPKFLDQKTADGTPFQKIALLHSVGTLATTVYQACRYWDAGTQCKYCTIPTSYMSGATVLKKSPEHFAEVLLAAEREGVVKNVLLTTGTPDTPDMGLELLISIIEAIREVSKIPVGVQFEPPVEKEWIRDVANAGANAIGMHIESADESIREEMCPGKFEYGPLDLYRRSWLYALDYLGRGNVSTFLLYGLGEDPEKTLMLVRELADEGVLPVVTPVRPGHGSQLSDFIPTYVKDLDASVAFYKKIGTILYENSLNPEKTAAGCHKCGGCTPGQEAYDWAAENHK
jgi:radical SAM protein (TIGR04043 family)